MSMGCAQQLRDATWALHGQAERAGIMPALLRGTLPLAGFCLLQCNLHALYAALEPALQGQAGIGAEAWQPLTDPALARAAHLADDLGTLHGAGWAAALPLQPAAADYAARLSALAERAPLLLAAHAYVRYLGDLAGGQAIRRRVRETYGLAGDAGTRFFDFGTPPHAAALALRLRAALDALPLDEPGRAALVAEAQWAFGQHVVLFEQLAALPQARPTVADRPADPPR